MNPILNSTICPLGQWYLVHCKRLRERLAARALKDNLGLTFYLPEIYHRIHGKVRQTPFFPGYMFVQANPQEVDLSAINAMPGVLRLVSFGAEPQPISANVIEHIRQRVDALNAAGGLVEHDFRPGDEVRLKDGPMRGLEAIFIEPMNSSKRVMILIDFLGSLRNTVVDVALLERSGSRTPLQEARRTRGHGRFINYSHSGF